MILQPPATAWIGPTKALIVATSYKHLPFDFRHIHYLEYFLDWNDVQQLFLWRGGIDYRHLSFR
jgi:hypothetical protein